MLNVLLLFLFFQTYIFYCSILNLNCKQTHISGFIHSDLKSTRKTWKMNIMHNWTHHSPCIKVLYTLYCTQFTSLDCHTFRLECNTCLAALQLYCLEAWDKNWIILYSTTHIYLAHKNSIYIYMYEQQPSELCLKGSLLHWALILEISKILITARHLQHYSVFIKCIL